MPDQVIEQRLILTEAEAGRRVLLLAELQAAFRALGVRCVLVRRRRLVLWYSRGPCGPSGPVNPELHVFACDGAEIATTDGATYSLASGGRYPAGDPAAAAAALARPRRADQARCGGDACG